MKDMIIDPDVEEKVYVQDSPIHGKGCFARKSIKKGDYIGDYKGPATMKDGTYVLWVLHEDGVFRGVNGKNQLKYLNHDRKHNAVFDGTSLYSLRRIKPDEEITIHYGEEWEDEED